ncbi:uncharacterized protein [Eleutherodactylus coqui]|uniref:uncharacterized protein n=1 Tax=Eleutherodactylus coqui TaxID=57060 RepID=UPI0034637E6A
MASAAVRDKLLCSICLSTYTDPVMLRCGHNFCRVCIHRVLDTQDEAGVYSCPECREESQERPALMRCLALCNIMENLLITPPTQTEAEIFCTYCVDSPVPAAKSCLLCEASLCKKHLRVHSKSAEHVLCEPSANLEDRKCSVHKKILEYYCTEDAACICVTCSLAGEHRGHRVEMLDEASEKKKERLRNVLQKLITRRKETEERVRNLEECRRKAQEKAAGEAERVTALCRDIRRQLDDLEKRVLSEISRQEKEESLSLSALIQKLEIQKDELSRKMRHMEELCNMTDPLTVLQEPDTGDLCDLQDTGEHDGGDGDTGGHDKLLHDVDGPDVAVISDTLHTLCDIVTGIRRGIYVADPADILLDVNTAGNNIHISDDLKTATWTQENRPYTAERFQHNQVMSRRGFSSGRYYWDVEGSRSGGWMVGMCYPSINRRQQSYIGHNNKSWSLRRCNNKYLVIHDSKEIRLPHIISRNRVRICLDYGAGRLSFYELCDPIRHLHTFTASFTEPLHAALWVIDGSITILGEATTGRNHNSAARSQRMDEIFVNLLHFAGSINYIIGLKAYGAAEVIMQSTSGAVDKALNVAEPTMQSTSGAVAKGSNVAEPTMQSTCGAAAKGSNVAEPTMRNTCGALDKALNVAEPTMQSTSGAVDKALNVAEPTMQSTSGAASKGSNVAEPTMRNTCGAAAKTHNVIEPAIQYAPRAAPGTTEVAEPTLHEILGAITKCSNTVQALYQQFGTLQEHMGLLRQDMQKTSETMTAAEGRISDIEDKMPPMQREVKGNTQNIAFLLTKIDDLENRSRRNNVRLVGLPERMEGNNPSEYIEKWILDLFGRDCFSPMFAIERAHRVPTRPPPPGTPPRPVLMKLLHFKDRDAILRRAREKGDIRSNGSRISFFPDFSAENQKKRGTFIDVKRRLRDLRIPYAMLYPARLRDLLNLPPPYSSAVMQRILGFVAETPDVPVLMVGDFNSVVVQHSGGGALVRPLWRFNAYWLNIIGHQDLGETLREYFELNTGSATIGVQWEAMKAYFRGILLQRVTQMTRRHRERGQKLREQLTNSEARFVESGTVEAIEQWGAAQENLTLYTLETAAHKSTFKKQAYYEEGEKAGHMLAMVSQGQRNSTYIIELRNEQGTLETDSAAVRETVRRYYASLYSSKLHKTQEHIAQYLADIELPRLTEEQREFLDSPVVLFLRDAGSSSFVSLSLSAMAFAAVRDELLCSICLSTYTDPVMLRCGHNFCRVCIHRVLDTQDEAGVYSCPECREESQERPALMRNLALRNIMENFLITPPTQTEAGIFCTYCVDSPVPAAKSCLLCEASLCEKHVRVHSKSAEHVLCEPSANLENRKCSVHKKILEYYCTEDAACICVSCSLAGEHRGHRVEMLDEASEKKKERLRNVLQKLTTRRKETEERVRSLEERRRKAQEKASGEAERVTALCRDIRRRLDDLEKRVLSEISRQEKEESLSLSAVMKKLEIQKDELSRKMRHMEELCNMTDPLTVLQEPDTGDLCDPEDMGGHDGGDGNTEGHDGGDGDTGGHGEPLHDVDGPDVAVISDTLLTLCDIVTDIRRGIYVEGPADILLDVNTAGNYIRISDDRKTATWTLQNQNRPETAERFQYHQVMSSRRFSSGRHYWDVDISRSVEWRVGMCYPSIDSWGQQSYIGYNNKSWCLRKYNNKYSVIHDSKEIRLPHIISSNRFRICLDYGAGRLSFYELCDPIRHLHTFTASFSEPLHAVLRVYNGSITILGEATTGRNHNRN